MRCELSVPSDRAGGSRDLADLGFIDLTAAVHCGAMKEKE
jgi:hypothetical protein